MPQTAISLSPQVAQVKPLVDKYLSDGLKKANNEVMQQLRRVNCEKELVVSLIGGGHLSRRLFAICGYVALGLETVSLFEHNLKLRQTFLNQIVSSSSDTMGFVKDVCRRNASTKKDAAFFIVKFHAAHQGKNLLQMAYAYNRLRDLVIPADVQRCFSVSYTLNENHEIMVTFCIQSSGGEVMVGSVESTVEGVLALVSGKRLPDNKSFNDLLTSDRFYEAELGKSVPLMFLTKAYMARSLSPVYDDSNFPHSHFCVKSSREEAMVDSVELTANKPSNELPNKISAAVPDKPSQSEPLYAPLLYAIDLA